MSLTGKYDGHMVNVHKAKLEDVDAIYELGEAVSEFSVNKDTVSFWPKEILVRAARSEDVSFIVAEMNKQIIGFIIANLNFSLRKAIIENIYVVPQSRGTGVGERLVDELLGTLNDSSIEYIATLIPEDADEALKLYINAGFSEGKTFRWLDKSTTNTFKTA